MKRIESPRDIAILSDGSQCLVTAVDSCGGIGEKAGDALYCPLELVGFHTARVALLEVLAAGASPAVASVSACNAPLEAGKMLEGIKRAFAGFSSLDWVVSTEKNMPTCMTALGVSVTGVCSPEMLRVGKSRSGDLLCLAGLPLVGREVLEAGDDMIMPGHMAALLGDSRVGSLLPVGSGGASPPRQACWRTKAGLKPSWMKAAGWISKSPPGRLPA